MDKLPVPYMRAVIHRAWLALDLATQSSHECSNLVDEAYESELRAERGHRRFGHRFTNGQAGYRLPPAFAARHFVMRHILDCKPDVQLADLGSVRGSVILAYRASIAMRRHTLRDIGHKDGPTAYDAWVARVSEPHEATAGSTTVHLIAGTIEQAKRFYAKRGPLEPMGALLVNGRDTYNEPLNVPLLRGLDYARDFAKR